MIARGTDTAIPSSGSRSWLGVITKLDFAVPDLTRLQVTDIVGEASFGESFKMLEIGKVSRHA
jgi:hypothetical protein